MGLETESAIQELTDGYPIVMTFLRAADRHGLELRYDGIYDRVINCLSEHVLLLVGGEEEAAINLLYSIDILAITAMISENFISHLKTSNLQCTPLWLEPANS